MSRPGSRPRDWADRDELASQLNKELTPRQREVLQLLAEGHTMAEVARILEMSRKTVMFHKYRIMRTFNLKNSADPVATSDQEQSNISISTCAEVANCLLRPSALLSH